MKSEISTIIKVKDNKVGILRVNDVDYISLTDLAKYQNASDPSGVIRNWMSNKDSLIFIHFGKNSIIKILIPWNYIELKLTK